MKYLLFLTLALSTIANSQELSLIKNNETAMLLATSHEIYSGRGDGHNIPYLVRAITSPTVIGECGGTIESCPDIRLFVVISMGDLGEIPKVLELPREKGWKFVSLSKSDTERVTLIFETTIPGANINIEQRNAWIPRKYILSLGHIYDVDSKRPYTINYAVK